MRSFRFRRRSAVAPFSNHAKMRRIDLLCFAMTRVLIGLGLVSVARANSGYAVEIDLHEQRAYLLRDGRMVMESPVSTGRANHRTPTGRFQIIQKDLDHRSSL